MAKEGFDALIADAEHLLRLASALSNSRRGKMRTELRESIGDALSVPKRERGSLDCVESRDLFVVLKPGSSLQRTHFDETELRPLLRQAIVATATAIESFVVASAQQLMATAFLSPTKHLKEVQVTLGDVLEVEARYTRRRWGHKELLAEHIERQTSANPYRVADTLRIVGINDLWNQVDRMRKVKQGTSANQLTELVDRRNRIAHDGDRSGRGRAPLSEETVARHIEDAHSIVDAIEKILSPGLAE